MLVPDSEIQTVLGAADVVVVPYRRFLNSAIVMLALSFGVPVIASENPVTRDATSSGMVTTFESVDQLAEELRQAPLGSGRAISASFAADHSIESTAETFAAAVSDLLQRGASADTDTNRDTDPGDSATS